MYRGEHRAVLDVMTGTRRDVRTLLCTLFCAVLCTEFSSGGRDQPEQGLAPKIEVLCCLQSPAQRPA